MKFRWIIPVVLLTLMPASGYSQIEAPDNRRLGSIQRFDPPSDPRDVVLLVSDRGGWDDGLSDMARHIAAGGRVVLGVDLKQFMAGMDATDDTCSWPAGDLEHLSQQIQKDLPFDQYRPPTLIGIGAGADLAYAAMTEVMPGTFAGGIGLDFSPEYQAPRPFCPGASSTALAPARFRFDPFAGLTMPWLTPPKPGKPDWATLDEGLDRIAADMKSASAVADLPVVEQPAAQSGDMMAIFLSGDGGWRDIDRQIGEALSRSGVSVVGIDALRYFWRERTPEETARDLERLIAYYTARWARPKVLLIGYSFGADVLPFAVNRLPPQVRRQVQLISLLGFATVADFEIRIAGWLGGHRDSALPTLPEIHRIDGTKIQCIYGDEEDDTGCTAPELAQADRLKMPGGHHFGGDYETVTRAILKAARFS